MITVFAFIANSASAQITVCSNGKVLVGNTANAAPASTLSVNGCKSGYEIASIGRQCGIYGEANGDYSNWCYGVYGTVPATYFGGGYRCGIMGRAVYNTPQFSSKSFGVKGQAGNALDGYNYGVFGGLNGTNNGAGIYGTATHNEIGSFVDGRYAGYFNGATKVNGNLTVTGSINGVILNLVSNSANISDLSNEFEKSSIIDKFSRLSATRYIPETPKSQTVIIESASDSDSVISSVNKIDDQSASRMHYGLDISLLKESFPELVYENEDGNVSVNYIEMIPILVQMINNLSNEIKILKSSGSFPYSERSSSGTSAVILSSDGQVIGTKRAK